MNNNYILKNYNDFHKFNKFKMEKFYSVNIANNNKETPESVSISFNIDHNYTDHFQYIPGQYLVLKANIKGLECRRSYSICSSKNELLTVAVKRVENGIMSTYLNEELKVGDQIEIQPPQGNFKLDNIGPSKSRKLVAFLLAELHQFFQS